MKKTNILEKIEKEVNIKRLVITNDQLSKEVEKIEDSIRFRNLKALTNEEFEETKNNILMLTEEIRRVIISIETL